MNVESLAVIAMPIVVGSIVIFGRHRLTDWRHRQEDRRKVRELEAFYRNSEK